jgi:hypothetical protein
VRVVVHDRRRDLGERAEAVGVAVHELADAHEPSRLEAGHDVDEYQPAGQTGVLTLTEQRGVAAHRRAYQHRPRTKFPDDAQQIADERVGGVVAIGGPTRLAVPARIDGHRCPAGFAQPGPGALPGVPSLPAAVQQQDGAQ